MSDSKPLVKNASDEAQVASSERIVKSRKEEELEALLAVLATPHGRRFVHWLLDFSGFTDVGVFQLSYMGDTNEMLVAEGRRQVGQHVLAAIMASHPQVLFQMMTEAKNRRENQR